MKPVPALRKHLHRRLLLLAAATLSLPGATHATGLTASDGAEYDYFGQSVSLFGNTALVGAKGNDDSGSAYLFRDLDSASGNITEDIKLIASDGAAGDSFGQSVSLLGNTALVGASGSGGSTGSAYVFRDLDTASGSITESVKLTASDGVADDSFGQSVSLSGNIALVGAFFSEGREAYSGAAYVFRNLDTASGTITQSVKLTASDGAMGDLLGSTVSLSGKTALVGAYGKGNSIGSAYVFRDLDTASGSITESVKLTASDGAAGDFFGSSVSLSGNTALVGAQGDDDKEWNAGSAYVFRNLDTASGSITENVKLTASDGAAGDFFGNSVSLSGSTALVGAFGKGSYSGAAYIYRDIHSASGSITENVKLTASEGAGDQFGYSVSLDGDQFVISALGTGVYHGKAYVGSVSSVTTLDEGDASHTITGISFVSQDDWVIGQTSDHNTVTLSAGDTADITASDKAVYIGQNAGSDHNTLVLSGTLVANTLYIGSKAGNEGNTLQIDSSATFGPVAFRLAAGNRLSLEGDFTAIDSLFTYLGEAILQVWDETWITLNSDNYATYLTLNYSSGYTNLEAIPEPGAWALGALGAAAFFLRRMRWHPRPHGRRCPNS